MAMIDGLSEALLPKDLPSAETPVDAIVSFDESKDKQAVKDENSELGNVVSFVKGKFAKAKNKRRWDEDRWIEAYNNYRGLYGPEVQFTDTETSRAFVKITKTKVLAAGAQIQEILFSGQKFPIGVEPTPSPIGVEETVSFDPKAPASQGGSPTIVRPELLKALGPLTKKLEPIQDKLTSGASGTPSALIFEPAKEAARELEKKIHDYLSEAQTDKSLRSFVFELSLFGNGIFKGPFVLDKEYPKWDEDGKYSPVNKVIPDVQFVSLWDAYPDPDARNMGECEYFIQRHRLNRSQLRQLKKRPAFRKESIELSIEEGPNYQKEHWENTLEDNESHPDIERFEVLEYWGVVDTKIAEEAGLDLPKSMEGRDEVQINVWVCNNQILRLVLNQFTPARIPYFSCPYEVNPYSFFGIGVAENMSDTQMLMNGFMRMAVDNGIKAGNVILEVDESMLVPGQSMDVYPGKIFRRATGAQGNAINAVKWPSTALENLQMFDKARQLADEETGMPSYSHGISGVMGVGRTASGMSMLMGAAKENIKSVVRNIDDYLLIPLGKALFAFVMQFDFDKKYIGDLEIVARGTESLMRNEVRSQKILQFLQVTNNPADAPFTRRDYLLREFAASLDLDPDKTVNDPREAALQAEQIKKMNLAQGIDPSQQAQGGNPAGAPQTSDPTGTGGGNIAPGNSPEPGAAGFTGAGGGPNGGAPASGAQGAPVGQ